MWFALVVAGELDTLRRVRLVQKFGGTSVATVDHIRRVAQRCLETQQAGHEVVAVVSAMSGETNRLLGLAKAFRADVNDREFDVILASGEQVSVGLLALAIRAEGGDARSFLGHQVRVRTDSAFSRARIRSIDCERLEEALGNNQIAVIAGFQGITEDEQITTLGRGGTDTTAVAIAAALKADMCEIYTDVDGVFTTDPNVVPAARKIDRITYEEMLELASLGAKVLQIRSVEFAMKYQVPIHVRSSFHKGEGTIVTKESGMEDVLVSGVTVVKDEAKITLRKVPDVTGVAAKVFAPLSDAGIVVDMIVQNIGEDGATDMTFTVPTADCERTLELLKERASEWQGEGRVVADTAVAKVSIVGVGMRSHSGVAQNMFKILAAEGINIQLISTSEIKVSCLIEEKYAELALRALHDGFALHNKG